MNGKEAINFLDGLKGRVNLHRKDGTDKFWSYKINSGKRTEIAFDPKTTTGLFVRTDREPPAIEGLSDIQNIRGNDVSTALDRVFSGGLHKASFVVTVADENALNALIEHYESL